METHSYGYLFYVCHTLILHPAAHIYFGYTFLTVFCGLLNQIKAPVHLLNRRRDVLVTHTGDYM